MKKILSIINIILPIILFIVLLFNTMSAQFVNIMTFSLVIGWIFPFIFPIITGISLLAESHLKMSFILNILTIILSIFLIIMIISLYDSNMLLILIFYITLSTLNLINTIYLLICFNRNNKEIKRLKKEENLRIKQIKKANNGIIKWGKLWKKNY